MSVSTGQNTRTLRTWIGAAAAVAASAVIALALAMWLPPAGATLVVTASGREVEFLEPAWFYLAALLPYFALVRGFSLTDVSRLQQALMTAVRAACVLGLAAALARPVFTDSTDRVAIILLVDVSESVSDAQLEEVRDYVDAVEAAVGSDDRLDVVTFAERPRRLRGDLPRDAAAWRHEGAGAGTDVQAAMQLAYGLVPQGYLPRMLIYSDGNETRGDMVGEAYRARELGIRVSWKTFETEPTEEIRVVGLRVPDDVTVGAPFAVEAEVWATHEDDVKLTLYQDDFPNALEPHKQVTLREGRNLVAFRSQVPRAGYVTYRVELTEYTRDTNPDNNSAVMTTPVQGRPRVLYVEGGLLQHPSSAGYLQRALDHNDIDVETRSPRGLPSDPSELRRFDLLLLSDVPAHLLGMAQMSAIERYVRDHGGGLITAGGEDSFGSGGYQGTRLERLMPVRMDSEATREQPRLAVMVVIDRSGSMSGQPIEVAKESARATVEVLSPSDLVGVLAFDTEPMSIVRLQRAANRQAISTAIGRLRAGGGTRIYPALREAYQILGPADAQVKHVILLSDGIAPYDGIAELTRDMRASGITVSAVGIGDADRDLLEMIVDNGGGRLYMTDDLAGLPRLFAQETLEAGATSLVEDPIRARVAKRVEMIEGTGVERAPPLHGYVKTQPKPRSEVILVTDSGEPLLARWRVGAGTSVAWTSDVKNRWGVDWIRWQGYPNFWAQVVRTSMRRKQYDSYDLAAHIDRDRARVVVDAIDREDQFVNELDTTLEVIDPQSDETLRSLPMKQTAPGRYEADFGVDRYGSYLLKAVHRRDGEKVAESTGGVALPYPEEYLHTQPNPAPMRQAAEVTGGLHEPAPSQALAPSGDEIETIRDLWPFVLLFVACGLIFDLYLKRVRLFGYRTRSISLFGEGDPRT